MILQGLAEKECYTKGMDSFLKDSMLFILFSDLGFLYPAHRKLDFCEPVLLTVLIPDTINI